VRSACKRMQQLWLYVLSFFQHFSSNFYEGGSAVFSSWSVGTISRCYENMVYVYMSTFVYITEYVYNLCTVYACCRRRRKTKWQITEQDYVIFHCSVICGMAKKMIITWSQKIILHSLSTIEVSVVKSNLVIFLHTSIKQRQEWSNIYYVVTKSDNC